MCVSWRPSAVARPALRLAYPGICCFNRCLHFLGACSYLVRANAYGKSAERIAEGDARRRGEVPKALSQQSFFLSGATRGRVLWSWERSIDSVQRKDILPTNQHPATAPGLFKSRFNIVRNCIGSTGLWSR